MSDSISREQAIDIVEKYDFDFPQYMERFVTELRDAMKTDIIHDLKHLPSADRPTEWIPVSERLPDIGDTYLVTVMVGKEIRTDVADSFGSYIDGFWDTFNDWIEDEECHVIAWMPLPPAYQGE